MTPPRPRIMRFSVLREILSTLLFGVAVFTLVQLAAPQSKVLGHSMDPTLHEGQRLLISRLNYLFGEPERGDIIVFNSPSPLQDNEPALIKRLIGIPGDTVEIIEGGVYLNGVKLVEPYLPSDLQTRCSAFHCQDNRWVLGPDDFFVMGDNRNGSRDSREFGVVDRHQIIGEAIFRLWPLDVIGSLQSRNSQ